MSGRRSISRRDFLHGLFRPAGAEAAAAPTFFETFSSGQSALSLLPPEFSGSMLKMEAARLGGDADNMTEEEMAALIVKAMYGTADEAAPRQEANGTALEQEPVPGD
ncbi:MAG: hypothetical protein IJC28_01270 [Mailhella sp.]|nr:hypothetical protein [Mailhella sp.]MBQ4325530.1 hypothetical protein [Mailhella sp.]